jgi:hypothetical protein
MTRVEHILRSRRGIRGTVEAQGQNVLYSTKISTQISYLKTSSHVSCYDELGGCDQQLDGHVIAHSRAQIPLDTRMSYWFH